METKGMNHWFSANTLNVCKLMLSIQHNIVIMQYIWVLGGEYML